MSDRYMESIDALKPLTVYAEPDLEFGHGQVMQYPKDGLRLFGPLRDTVSPAEIRVGVVGTNDGIGRYKRWIKKINAYIPAEREGTAHHTAYPGFEAIFGCRWPESPICEVRIDQEEIRKRLFIGERHEAIFTLVTLFKDAILRYRREHEAHVDLWFVVIPEEVYKFGRPQSRVPTGERIQSETQMTTKQAKSLQIQPSLFQQINEDTEPFHYHVHFRDQLKARLLKDGIVIQVVRETSLTPEEFISGGVPMRRVQDPATLAWNLTTTAYFKSSGRPWKLADVREGVCYVGVVFKRKMAALDAGNACCGAQMFLDSGDGMVFKGAVGPWYSDKTKEFHLSKRKARELMTIVINAYIESHVHPPKELFIHGKTRFNDDEWEGFRAAVPGNCQLVGVRIRDERQTKLYSRGNRPVLRGTALILSRRKALLWTRGFIPRLMTYPGREVPNPLSVEISQGEADLDQVLKDILGLTKVNFNACIFADGFPVTLRFADMVGAILTATPLEDEVPPLPFKHYI